MNKVKRKIVAMIIRGMRPMTAINTIKELSLSGDPSVHHIRPKIKRLYTTGKIRIGKNDTIVTCESRESLRQLRGAIRKECKDLCQKPRRMETFSAIITEDKEPFYA